MENKRKRNKVLLALGLSFATLLSSTANTFANSNKKLVSENQNTSEVPIVEVSKDNITFSGKMKGILTVHLENKGSIYNIRLGKAPKRATKGNFSINKLKNKYKAKLGSKFYIIHDESGKKQTRSKDFYVKDKYDKPEVEFIQRSDSSSQAKFKIVYNDNKNFEKTAITNRFPQLKVQKGNEVKTYDVKKGVNEIEIKDGYLEYKVNKSTPNGTTLKFSQSGKNFNESDITEVKYQIDLTEANKVLKELKENTTDKNKNILKTFEEAINKKDATQEEIDQKTESVKALLLTFKDSLSKKRSEAIVEVKKLNQLSEEKKNEFTGKITGATTLEKIEQFLKEAKSENDKLNAPNESAKPETTPEGKKDGVKPETTPEDKKDGIKPETTPEDKKDEVKPNTSTEKKEEVKPVLPTESKKDDVKPNISAKKEEKENPNLSNVKNEKKKISNISKVDKTRNTKENNRAKTTNKTSRNKLGQRMLENPKTGDFGIVTFTILFGISMVTNLIISKRRTNK